MVARIVVRCERSSSTGVDRCLLDFELLRERVLLGRVPLIIGLLVIFMELRDEGDGNAAAASTGTSSLGVRAHSFQNRSARYHLRLRDASR